MNEMYEFDSAKYWHLADKKVVTEYIRLIVKCFELFAGDGTTKWKVIVDGKGLIYRIFRHIARIYFSKQNTTSEITMRPIPR